MVAGLCLSCSKDPVSYTNTPVDEMVALPAGTFTMGDQTGGGWGDERPAHLVSVSAFSISATEVTQREYLRVRGWHNSRFTQSDILPVENVSWYDAVLYCNARSVIEGKQPVYSYSLARTISGVGCYALDNLVIDHAQNGYRLPTEAEWEYACKAGSSTACWWGDTAASATHAWVLSNAGAATHAVATLPANAFGLYDMHGNVGEWVEDWFSYYASADAADPAGPPTGSQRIVRGGCWNLIAAYSCSSTRDRESPEIVAHPNAGSGTIGFRVVLPQ